MLNTQTWDHLIQVHNVEKSLSFQENNVFYSLGKSETTETEQRTSWKKQKLHTREKQSKEIWSSIFATGCYDTLWPSSIPVITQVTIYIVVIQSCQCKRFHFTAPALKIQKKKNKKPQELN